MFVGLLKLLNVLRRFQMIKFEELTKEVLCELEKRGNTKLSRDNLRYFWNGLANYLNSKGVEEFNLDIAMEYFELRKAKKIDKRYLRFMNRAILLLEHYIKFGEIPLRICTPTVQVADTKYNTILSTYESYLNEREYANTTIKGYLNYILRFLNFASDNGCVEIDDWDSTLIFKYIMSLSSYAKSTIKHKTGSLRLFLKYLYIEGMLLEDLSVHIGIVKGRYHQKLPSVWTKQEVLDLLNVFDRNNPNEKRDYAMVLIVARLGLRSVDVKKLKLEHFHWKENIIVINQSKTGIPLTLPLLQDVGWAVIDYVENARPKIENDYIFLTHVAPYRELSEDNHLYKTLEKYMTRANLPIVAKRKSGMHSLRHTLATALLQQETALSDISNILGHTSIDSTSVYLKSDIERLRDCAIDITEVLNNG